MRDHRGQHAKMRKIDRRFFRGMIFGRACNDSAKRARNRYWFISILLALAMFICMVVPSMMTLLLISSPLNLILFALPLTLMGTVLMVVNFAGSIGGMLLGFSVFLVGYFFLMRSAMAELITANGFCGSCCYSIAEVTPESDGCTVCPECGSAWRCHEKSPATS